MRTLLLAIALIAIAGAADAQQRGYGYGHGSPYGGSYGTHTYGGSGSYGTGSNPYSHQNNGYVTPRGTNVEPYYQTNPNSTQMDNYGTRGNQNPWNGTYGTRTPRY